MHFLDYNWQNSAFADIFDEAMRGAFEPLLSNRPFSLDVDILDDEQRIVFEADAPGVKREDLHVGVENGVLTISGTRATPKDTKGTSRRARMFGAFSRAFRLPKEADDSKLTARLADGVLTIEIPRKAQAETKSRKIDIA